VKIWTKRAAGVGAIIGGLLVAGTVAAGASDVPLLGDATKSAPVVGQASQAIPAGTADPASALKRSSSRAGSSAARTAAPDSSTDISGVANATKATVDVGDVTLSDVLDACGNAVAVADGQAVGDCPEEDASKGPDKGDGTPGKPNGGTDTETTDISGLLNATELAVRTGRITATGVADICGNAVEALGGSAMGDCPGK